MKPNSKFRIDVASTNRKKTTQNNKTAKNEATSVVVNVHEQVNDTNGQEN